MGTHPIFESDFDCLTETLKHFRKSIPPMLSRRCEMEIWSFGNPGLSFLTCSISTSQIQACFRQTHQKGLKLTFFSAGMRELCMPHLWMPSSPNLASNQLPKTLRQTKRKLRKNCSF